MNSDKLDTTVQYKIMIVEDDLGIAQGVQNEALRWNIQCHIAERFDDVIGEFAAVHPHLVVMDIGLPLYDGYHWCKQIRSVSKVPIIFLSSASDNLNIVMAINMGADDFVSKPFDGNVLLAKIQAMLRRTYRFNLAGGIIEHRGAILDISADILTYQGKKVDLTKNEYKILLCLMENKGKVVSREFLMERLWDQCSFVDENTLSVNVNRLRKKLVAVGLHNFITTKVGVGYLVEQS